VLAASAKLPVQIKQPMAQHGFFMSIYDYDQKGIETPCSYQNLIKSTVGISIHMMNVIQMG